MSYRTLDTDEVLSRIEELSDEREAIEINASDEIAEIEDSETMTDEERESAIEALETKRDEALDAWDESHDATELQELRGLVETVEGYSGDSFRHTVIIHSDDFKDYAEEFASEVVEGVDSAQWPFNCIDWEQAASELAMDYTTVEYEGQDYMFR